MFCDFGVSSSLYFLRKCFSGDAPLSLYLMDGTKSYRANRQMLGHCFVSYFAFLITVGNSYFASGFQKTEYNLGTVIQPPFHEAMAEFFTDAFHQGIWIVFVLLLIGVGTLFWQRKISRIQAYFLLWGVIPLPVFYLLNPILQFFTSNYISWVFIGIAGFIGLTVNSLPRWARRIGIGVSSVLFLLPIPVTEYHIWGSTSLLAHHLSANFDWLRGEIQAGDHVLLAED